MSHLSQNTLAVNLKAAVLEFCSHPPLTVAGKFQRDILKLILLIVIFHHQQLSEAKIGIL